MRPQRASAPAPAPVAPLPPRGPGRRVPFSMPIDICSALRLSRPLQGYSPLCADPAAASQPPEPRGPRFVRVVLSPTSSLGALTCQSAGLRATSRHPPVIGPVPDIHWIILSVLLTSRVPPRFSPELPPSARRGPGACISQLLPRQHWPSGGSETLGMFRCSASVSFMR